jgi:hypothetical protein
VKTTAFSGIAFLPYYLDTFQSTQTGPMQTRAQTV